MDHNNLKYFIISFMLLIFASSLSYAGQKRDYFPLVKGNYWVYQDRTVVQDENGKTTIESSGMKVKVNVINVIRTLRVLSVTDTENYKIAHMQEINPWPKMDDPQRTIEYSYVIDKKNGNLYKYDDFSEKLSNSSNFKIDISKIPEYIIPLKIGTKWGDPVQVARKDNCYCNWVRKKENVTVPAGTFKECFKIVYITNPDDSAEWFCPYIGVVRWEYHHHGTIVEYYSRLKEYKLN